MRLSQHFIGIAIAGLSLAAPATPGLAEGDGGAAQRTITVPGQGEAKAAPDEAKLRAGVVTSGKKAADALAANTHAMNEVFATLRRLGIPDKSIQTTNLSVAPQYASDRNGDTTQQIAGYQVQNEVVVTVDDLAKLGAAVDALIASGANTLGNMEFTIRDPKPLLAQARAEAIRDAMARAGTYAAAGQFQLGPILSINESGAETPRPMMGAPMMRMAAPVASGENSVNVTVNVTFEIR